jgi:hypothetical protein
MFVPSTVLAGAWLALVPRGSGEHPFLGFAPDNLAEAAAFRDGGAIVRRIEAGEDPNRPAAVRAGVIGDDAVVLRPLEAAAAQLRPEIVQLLIDVGASPDAEAWTRAWCAGNDANVRIILARHRPSEARPDCAESDTAASGSP